MALLSEVEDLRFDDLATFYGAEEAEAIDIPLGSDLSVFIEEEIEESEDEQA